MYRQGDILLIPVPFSDLTSSKKRPVLVLSNTKYNTKTDDIVVAAITSNIISKDYTIFISNNDMDNGFLKVDSCIRTDKLYTISQSIIITRIGKIKSYIIDNVKENLYKLFLEK